MTTSSENNPRRLRGKLLHPRVSRRVRRLYELGFFEEAILNAFKVVDERLREVTELSDAEPLELVKSAFHPNTGRLANPQAWPSERDGIHQLFRGAFLSFRNAPAHRFTDPSEEDAFDLIVLANRLLLIIEEAHLRFSQSIGPPQIHHQLDSQDRTMSFVLDTDNDGELEMVVPIDNLGNVGEVIRIFDDLSNDPYPAEVEELRDVPSQRVDTIVLADVDNDNLNEVVYVGASVGMRDEDTSMLFYKHRDGKYEILSKDPTTLEEKDDNIRHMDHQWFDEAQITDFDNDGSLEVVSEPDLPIPRDLIPENYTLRDDYVNGAPYLRGRIRYVWKWNSDIERFELLQRELLYVNN